MKNPHRKKSLQENFTEIFSQEENQNVIVYLKHTQKRQTDCKREPWLVLRHIKTEILKTPNGEIKEKIPRENIKHCYYWSTFIYIQHCHENFSYLNKKMNMTFFDNSCGEILPM